MPSWRLIFGVGVIVAAFWAGWLARGTYERARDADALQSQIHATNKAQRAANEANAANTAAEVARLAAQAENYALGQQLEDQAYADTSNSCGLSAGRVERLRQR
ncbi:hypothetical protein DL1_00010 [Thioclava dalianensis]|uniref:Uncharacterized protein n=1 Tax=Thioclava dalianensis TaxID=1185766 RepID=A0A074TS68_9RHOB|nr:hypothetical protein [Thioclava dalianensis]KEP71743.1 hypothetical protein DL1_00010 [Thioclava dalianensis]